MKTKKKTSVRIETMTGPATAENFRLFLNVKKKTK